MADKPHLLVHVLLVVVVLEDELQRAQVLDVPQRRPLQQHASASGQACRPDLPHMAAGHACTVLHSKVGAMHAPRQP